MFDWYSITTTLTVMMAGLIVWGLLALVVLAVAKRLPDNAIPFFSPGRKLKKSILLLGLLFPWLFWTYKDPLIAFYTELNWASLLLGSLGVCLSGVAVFFGVLGLVPDDEEESE